VDFRNPEQDFVLKTVESRDVHFVRCWFSDVLGNVKSFAIVPGELEHAFSDGMGFDGACIEGFPETKQSDLLAFPDASTFQVLPWRPQQNAVARMFSNIKTPAGIAFEGDPRHVLISAIQAAQNKGFLVNVGAGLEYYYFKDAHGTEGLDRGSYFDLTSLDYASDLRRDTVLTLEMMGIPVEYSHHDAGPSQNEIDLRYTDALSMADSILTYKLVVKEIALNHGVHASFMPKPLSDHPGSSMKISMSLTDMDGENVFFDANDPSGYYLSKTAKQFIAGLLKYAPEYCLVTNQYVNSYKRLNARGVVPVNVSWGQNDRASIVRIPGFRPTSAEACRLELRSPDPAANPYLVLSVMLAAGLAGIEQQLELEPSVDQHAEGVTGGAGTPCRLPETLGEAAELFANSELMKHTLGEHIHAYLTAAKRKEWQDYQRIVTQWELDKFLAVL
jgi:glutamine synthetase